MEILNIFQKEDNTSRIDIDLLTTSYKELKSGRYFGEIKSVELKSNKLFIFISNKVYAFTIIIHKNSKKYNEYIKKFSFDSDNNVVLEIVKAKIDIDVEKILIKENLDEDDWLSDNNEYSYLLSKFDLEMFESNFSCDDILFDFLLEHYNFIIDLSLIHYKLDSHILDLLEFNQINDFLYEHNSSLEINGAKKLGQIRFDTSYFRLRYWFNKLKNTEFNSEKWLESKVNVKKSGDSDEEDYSLEDAGYTYDEDSEIYSFYDGPSVNTIIEREFARQDREAYQEMQRQEYEMERDIALLKEFYFENEIFSKESWKDFSSIIDDEVIYYLILNKEKRKNIIGKNNYENELDLDDF